MAEDKQTAGPAKPAAKQEAQAPAIISDTDLFGDKAVSIDTKALSDDDLLPTDNNQSKSKDLNTPEFKVLD